MQKNQSFTEGKILSPLISFALPVLLALFLQAMYGAVDLMVVGQFNAALEVSAVSTGSRRYRLLKKNQRVEPYTTMCSAR